MAEIDNFGNSWQGLTHGDVEDAIKAKVAALELLISQGSASVAELSPIVTGLRTDVNSLLASYPASKVSVSGYASLLAKLAEMDTLIAQAVQTGGDVDLSGYYTSTQVDSLLSSKANDNAVVKSISVNGGTAQTPQNGNVNIEVQGGLTKDDINVETQGDGTVDINVKDDTYTINLNHGHENMAKVVLKTSAAMPVTKELDTIYVQVDNPSTPTEIQKLFIAGLEFEKGWVPDTGEPAIKSPSNGTAIGLGVNDGSGVSKTITVRGWNLTGDLMVAVGTGFSLTYGQLTGQSSITIAKSDALLGAQVTIVFSGSDYFADGAMVITHGNDVLSSVALHVGIDLPSGYTRLDYVDNVSTGILTNIPVAVSTSPFVGSKWKIDTELAAAPSAVQICICSDNEIAHWFGALTDGKLGIGTTADGWTFTNTGRNVYDVEFVSKGIKVTCNGTTKTRTNSSNLEHPSGLNVALLGKMNSQTQSPFYSGKIYSIKCTSGGSFNGVPAKRNIDNKIGLYDTNNGIFYPLTT